jgi:hypothetical protein
MSARSAWRPARAETRGGLANDYRRDVENSTGERGKGRTPLDEPAPSDEALSRSTVSRTVCLKSGLPAAGPPASGALAAPAAAAAGPADADGDADKG